MNILVAIDSFKGSCSSIEASTSIEKGIHSFMNDAVVTKIPIADGGEGTIEALVFSLGGEIKSEIVKDPLGREIYAKYGILADGTAVIETAAASGLSLVGKYERNPMLSTSFGTGQLIKIAVESGCKKIILGLGGSACNDAGVGLMQALGVSFKDENNIELEFGGGNVGKLNKIDISGLNQRVKECEIIVASDVKNPLCGENGASAIYGPQKGATSEMVTELDKNLNHFANIVKSQLNKDIMNIPGAGAAGGIGAGVLAFLDVKIKSGIDIILDAVCFDKLVENADIVITGEGRMDSQTINGKVPVGVAVRTKNIKNIPVFAIVGAVDVGFEQVYDFGIDSVMCSVYGVMSLEDVLKDADKSIESAANRLIRIFAAGRGR